MEGFNLLPADLAPKPEILKVSKILSKISIVGYSIFIVSLILTIGIFIYFKNEYDATLARNLDIKDSIQAMRETEKSLILVQDRLDKIKVINTSNQTSSKIASLADIYERMDEVENAYILSFSIDDKFLVLDVSVNNSDTFEDFSQFLKERFEFKAIEIEDFTFDRNKGYLAKYKISV
jgi:hypothetical protein